jgi:hypothetical protein|tara:strand:+ start:487 stop:993 length:507 start_codon:yes stop_codon:yes gene_type:complete
MPTPTYTLIDSVTLASSAASVTFSNIDQSFGDVILSMTVTNDAGSRPTRIAINGDTGYNYTRVEARGNGTTAASYSDTNAYVTFSGDRSFTSGVTGIIYQFMDYSATNKHKSILARLNNTNASADPHVTMGAGRWASTAGIASLLIYPSSGNFIAGCTFHIYGIAKAL